MPIKTLTVTVEASTTELVEDMIEQLARSACDVSNSMPDDEACITVFERTTKRLPQGNPRANAQLRGYEHG